VSYLFPKTPSSFNNQVTTTIDAGTGYFRPEQIDFSVVKTIHPAVKREKKLANRSWV
jgi:hypothetical protein